MKKSRFRTEQIIGFIKQADIGMTVNGRGQPVQETYGNGMVLLPQYKSQSGQVTELKYMLGSGELRKLNYAYDKDPPARPFHHARRRVHRC